MADQPAPTAATCTCGPGTAACRECGVEADACCADLGYPCCWLCTVTNVAHQEAQSV